MKRIFLEQLEELLYERDFTNKEIKDILSDYSQMIDDAIESGKTESEAIAKLGQPKYIVQALVEEKKATIGPKKKSKNKVVALMPFIAIILFFGIGFGLQIWHPTWLVFFLIPMSAIVSDAITNKKNKYWFTSLTPFLAVTGFLVLGFYYRAWHPGWLIFFLIPVSGILEHRHRNLLHMLTALSPFLAITAFFILGEFGLWNPGWLVFLLIPMLGLLNKPNKSHVWVGELAFLIAIGLYLYIGYTYQAFMIASAAFLIPVIYLVLVGDIKISLFKGGWVEKITFIVALIVYIGIGLWTQTTWPWLWVVFLSVPVVAILKGDSKQKLVAISPFIALTIFIVVGFFFQAFHISWLAFLLIPMISIIKQ